MSLDITTLAFAQLVGIERHAAEPRTMVLPASADCANHIGTVHAGALYTLAECCSGNRIIEVFGPRFDDVLTVLRRAEVKYRSAAAGTLQARPAVSDDAVEAFLETFNTRGRGLLPIDAVVTMADDTRVMQATFQWYVTEDTG